MLRQRVGVFFQGPRRAGRLGAVRHRRAQHLADGLRALGIDVAAQHTNMVFIDIPKDRLDAFRAHMDTAGIRMSIGYLPRIRMVTHLDIDDAGIDRAIAAFRSFGWIMLSSTSRCMAPRSLGTGL